MSILRDFEKRLEGKVEGFFARAFRSQLQPVELAKAVQRYAGSYQQVGIDGVIVPNVYRFVLSGDDLDRFEGYAKALQRELAQVVSRTADDNEWILVAPVRIEFQRSDDLKVGMYELRGKVDVPEEPAAPEPAPVPRPHVQPPPPPRPVHAPVPDPGFADDGGGATVVMAQPGSQVAATLIVQDGSGRRHSLSATEVIGRHPHCDLVLDDPSVSRRHARFEHGLSGWSVTDLNSTNGIKVNGSTVDAAPLDDGDRVELGTVRMTFILDT